VDSPPTEKRLLRRLAAAFDLAVVVVFIVLGRAEHDSTAAEGGSALTALVTTLAPFAIALGAAWAQPSIRRAPLTLRSGALIWAATLVGGLALRALVFGDGIAPAFIAVAAGFTALGIIGWRAISQSLTPGS
jgi:hypothetical protein